MLMRKVLARRETYRAILQAAKKLSTSAPNRYVVPPPSRWSVPDNEIPNMVKSPFPDVEIPEIHLHEYIFQNTDLWPDKTAVECVETGRSYTYLELREASKKFSSFLKKAKMAAGDVVALVLPNCPEYAIVLLGASASGAVVTTINPAYSADEISHQLNDSLPRCVVTTPYIYPAVKAALEKVEQSKPTLVVCVKTEASQPMPGGTVNFQDILTMDAAPFEPVSRKFEDVVLLPYSSGTTGLPKGVMLSHRNIVANIQQLNMEPSLHLWQPTTGSCQDVTIGLLPFFHIYGLVVILLGKLCVGCKIVTVPKFSPQGFLDSLTSHKPSFLYLVPPIMLFLADHPSVKPKHLESLKYVMTGASPIGVLDTDRLKEKLSSRSQILQGYGLTETSPLTHQLQKTSDNVKSIGRPVPNTAVRVLELDTSLGLGPNQPGHICIRGPQVMEGYYNNYDATVDSIRDGWFYTGDIGYYDPEGYFYIIDRLKELIKVKGFQVPPAELEEVLRSHPGILDAAVIGVPDERSGELPKAFVVRSEGHGQLTEREVVKFIESKVADYKQLAGGVEFVDAIPKTASGKILRKVLRNLKA